MEIVVRSILYEKQQGNGALCQQICHQSFVNRFSHSVIPVRFTRQTILKDVSDGSSMSIIVSQVAGQCIGITLLAR